MLIPLFIMNIAGINGIRRGIALQAAEEEPPKRFPSSIITNDDLVISIDLAIWSIQIEHI